MSARRTLRRVEQITETVARIGSEELGERLPEPVNSDEISRLAETFNRMLDRIQSSVNQLRSVTDSVAHDLKTPVTSIREPSNPHCSKSPDDAWRDSVGEAIEGLDKLTYLLNTMLDLAEAQAGALSLDRRHIILSDMVKQVVEVYQPAMAERQHEVAIDLTDDVVVAGDLPLLNRVITNLLENELAHLPPGRQIHLRLRSQQGSAELVIEDNGPGFPPDIIARAFERFVKGKHSKGHGLGLAFVDAVVQAHGGTIKISDHPGGGAVIALSLPAYNWSAERRVRADRLKERIPHTPQLKGPNVQVDCELPPTRVPGQLLYASRFMRRGLCVTWEPFCYETVPPRVRMQVRVAFTSFTCSVPRI